MDLNFTAANIAFCQEVIEFLEAELSSKVHLFPLLIQTASLCCVLPIPVLDMARICHINNSVTVHQEFNVRCENIRTLIVTARRFNCEVDENKTLNTNGVLTFPPKMRLETDINLQQTLRNPLNLHVT